MIQANPPLALQGPRNLRDLGGYPTLDDKQTRPRQFLRSDSPARFTLQDCQALYDYGVRLQVDLRSVFECQREPSALQNFLDVEYHNVQMVDDFNSNLAQTDRSPFATLPNNMADTYISMLDTAGPRFATAFRWMLRYPDDCVLFNCTAGKDRTGVTAMLLLKIARCPDDVILADYAATYDNIRQDVEQIMQMYATQGIQLDVDVFHSDPETMAQSLRHLDGTYGSIEDWLTFAGLTTAEIDALRHKLVG